MTKQIGPYAVTFEKIGRVWRAQVNGKTICACPTKRDTLNNADFICRDMHPAVRKALFG